MSSLSPSPETIPDLVIQNVEKIPSHPFYIYADLESGEIVTITQLEFGRATHRAAHLLRPNHEGRDGEVIVILAESDTMLYHAIVAGLMTANFIPFPISPRNSAAAILHLLRASSCHRIVATCVTLASSLARLQKHAADVDPDFALNIQEIPSMQQIYPNLGTETSDCSFQPYSKTQIRPKFDDIFMYIHSSGSSGFPKAIPQTYRQLKYWYNSPGIAVIRDRVEKPIANMALPAFHLLGINYQLLQPLSGTCVAVFPPTATSPNSLPMISSPSNILEHAQRTKCRSLAAVPTLLVFWFNSPDAVEYLSTLHTIIWGGGPLPQRVGDGLVDAGVNLLLAYGTTETGGISAMWPYGGDERDWAWFRISDRVNVRWMPQGDGTFECQLLTSETHVPMVENLPDVRGYATSDLCINHPEKKHLWRIVGRVDDTVIHTSGEKTVPAPMENIITSSPFITAAVVFGHERVQTGVLIETPPDLQIDVKDLSQLADLRNKVWPVIEEANEVAPGFSRIYKEMILFSSPDKPLARAGKGTVMRKATIKLYAPEIDAIYNMVEEQLGVVDSIAPPTVWEAGLIQPWLLQLAASVCNFTKISPEVDFRQQGFDSLTATIFRLHIVKALRNRDFAKAAAAIPQNLIYSHPTISKLSTFLEGLVGGTVTDTEIQTGRDAEYSSPSSSETIVELRSEGGIPLIMFPGIRGTIDAAMALRANFSGTLWGVQITGSTTISPLSAQAAFLAQKIQEKRPKGPYRLTGYSGTSVVAVAVAKLLEEAGEQVLQLSFIDHFPLLWTIETTQPSLREKRLSMVGTTFAKTIKLLGHDPLYGPDSDRLKEFEEASAGSPHAKKADLESLAVGKRMMSSLIYFLGDFFPPNVTMSPSEYADSFNRWVCSVKAPLSALTAEFGVVATMSDDVRRDWGDLGAGRCQKPVKHSFITGVGHYGILGDKRTAAFLQQY
ncbi:hypothetical protein DFH07DRAFT_798512 [Mycena maculata]|uniref:Polyketide synthase-like phosphopantetheine-binding domain-containing protein n=1 Tax=Mycena maculata TaxID=230809 RepID=A0AAD7K1V6_9AGAR|nr:hypothetical protein DFH07DRAFT_798512 [Mycena maculata]